MEQHPLTNQSTFEKWLTKLSCNGCLLFIDEKCTHQNAEEHEKDKAWLVDDSMKRGTTFSVDWAKNINDYYVCDDFKDE